MGVYLSAPVTEKVSYSKDCGKYTYGVSSMQGWRITQEDAHNCISDFDEGTNTALFAVYDGHGGAEVAQYASAHLPDFIKSLPLYKEGKLGEALEEAFLGFDAKLTQEDVIKELKTLAGVDDDDQDEVEDDEGIGRSELELLVAQANMPIEELMAKYNRPVPPHIRTLQKEAHPSPALKAKKAPVMSETANENIASNSLVSRLENGQPDNDNNVNAEKELRKAETMIDNVKTEVNNIDGNDVNKNNSHCSDLNSELTKDGENESDCKAVVANNNGGVNFEDCTKLDCTVSSGDEITGVSSTTNEAGSSLETETSEDCQGESSSGCGACSSSSGVETGGSGLSPGSIGASAEHDEDSSEDEEYNSSNDEDDDDEYIEENDDEEDEDEYDDDDPEHEGGIFGVRSVAGEDQDDHAEEPGTDSGCTAVLTLLRNNEVFVANAGDSRCVLCRNGQAMDLSVDHKPEDESELSRITAAGGTVKFGRVNGGLNLSRALGDHWYKRNETKPAREQMISALPDIMTATVEQNDEFLVIACDGIWNFMSSQDVVDFVKERLKDPAKRSKPSLICEEIFDTCLAPNTSGDGTGCDNMTCIIVVFNRSETSVKQDPGDHESLPADVKSSKRDPESRDTLSLVEELQPPSKRAKLGDAMEDFKKT